MKSRGFLILLMASGLMSCSSQNVKPNTKVKRATIEFGFNSVQIPPLKQVELTAVKKELERAPEDTVVLVEGYADRIGSNDYNYALALERAQAVRDYIVKQGVPNNFVFTKSYGELSPIVEDANWKERRLNRRVEVKLIERDQLGVNADYSITRIQ